MVEELAAHQHMNGEDVRVITSNLGMTPDYEDRVPVERLRAIEIAHTPLMPGLFFRLLRVKKNDIVHAHVAQAFMPEMVYLASKIRGFKYVTHVHLDIAPSGAAGVLLKIYKPLILRAVLRAAKFVVVFSEEQKAVMMEKYGLSSDRVRVIPNGVDEAFYHTQPRALHTFPRLLFVGRLSHQKNLSQLLGALEGISDKFETRLVGDGELRTSLEQKTQELGLKNVHFMGRKDGEALKELYRESDIFVLPSEREGMPLVLLEALAMALPIVGTDVTGTRDLVVPGTNGLLAPLGDTETYRTALLDIIRDPARYRRMSQQALADAQQYSWAKVVQRFGELYEAS